MSTYGDKYESAIEATGYAVPTEIEITVDDEFKALCPSLSPEELAQLTANIIDDGCRDPLVAWDYRGKAILLDGHNRLAICEKHDLPYEVEYVEGVETRGDARLWIVNNQRGRRNLPLAVMAELVLAVEEDVKDRAKANMAMRKGDQPGATLPNSGELQPIDTDRDLADETSVRNQTEVPDHPRGESGRRKSDNPVEALELEPLIAVEAERRMKAGKAPDPTQKSAGGETREKLISPGQGARTDREPFQKSGKVDAVRESASRAGVSHDTIAKAKVIRDKASDETKLPATEAVYGGNVPDCMTSSLAHGAPQGRTNR